MSDGEAHGGSTPEYVHGKVVCPCGYEFALSYPKETPSPAYYKTWCVECGLVLEGHVELSPDVGEGPHRAGEVRYVPIDKIHTRGRG